MSIYEVTGRVLGAEDTAENKTKMPAHLEHTEELIVVQGANEGKKA